MATTNIELDIENITGVSDADDQFVKTAQKWVVSSIPKDLMLWAGTSTSTGSHGGNSSTAVVTLPQPTDNIIDVQRNGFSAEEVPESLQGFIANSSSLHFATEIFPKYYIQAGNKVVVKPSPSDSETALVNYVDFLKIDDDCDLRGAVINHACASEFNKLATAATPSTPDFGSSLVIGVSPPTALSAPSFTYTNASVSDIVAPLVTISDMASLSTSAPTYTKPVQSFDVSQFETFLETEEDIELAQGQLGRLSHEIQEYQANIQSELNEFNKENVAYQEDIQRKTQNFQKDIQVEIENIKNRISSDNTNIQKDVQIELQNRLQDFQQDVQEYSAKVNRYSAELNQYQQDVNKEVQSYSNTLGKEVQEYQAKISLYSSKVSYLSQKADKYYQMAIDEITMYVQNNSKMINKTMAAQVAAQRGA